MSEAAQIRPHVTVGIPVYNGAKTLSAVLDNITTQTLRDIEIVISDNGSSDRTPEICREFARRDSRIRYFRRQDTICATNNFNFVLKEARAPFFMWCAHDDTRNAVFIEALLEALHRNPAAILSFGKIVEYKDGATRDLPLDFVQAGRSKLSRLRWAALSQLHHLYGLWRTEALRKLCWEDVDWWHDTPPMMAATMIGDFVFEPAAELHYLHNSHHFLRLSQQPGLAGLGANIRLLARRVGDIVIFIWLCGKTVGRVAGFGYGLAAALFGAEKIATQVVSFVWRRAMRVRGICRGHTAVLEHLNEKPKRESQ